MSREKSYSGRKKHVHKPGGQRELGLLGRLGSRWGGRGEGDEVGEINGSQVMKGLGCHSRVALALV